MGLWEYAGDGTPSTAATSATAANAISAEILGAITNSTQLQPLEKSRHEAATATT